jgi:hypothetical protein
MGGRWRLLAIACAVAIAAGLSPVVSAHAAPKKVISARTSATWAMPAPGYATVQSVKLPAGTWTVIAKATAINAQSRDFVRCQLQDATNGVTLDGSTTQVGNFASQGAPLTNIATVTAPAPITVQQRCGHDSVDGNNAYLDSDASLVAFAPTGGLDANQMSVRTTSQTAMYTITNVLSMSLAAGPWVVGFKFTAVNLQSRGPVECRIDDASGPVTPATGVSMGAPDTGLAGTGTGVGVVRSGSTITLKCYEPLTSGPNVYLDPGAVLWARKTHSYTAVRDSCGSTVENDASDLVLVEHRRSCPIFDGQTQLAGAVVSKGTWIALGGETEVQAPDDPADYTRCELIVDNRVHLDGSAAWESPGNYTGIPLVATVKATGPLDIQERCRRDTAGQQSLSFAGALALIRL